MRIAFYAPMKPPTDPTPSGDRRMARLLIQALETAGHEVSLASTLRSHERDGDAARQIALRAAGKAEAAGLIRRYRARAREARPEAWFTYHLYHKAPDWLGPPVSRALKIPYLVAEASVAPKQVSGRWAEGYAVARAAVADADAVLAVTEDDANGLKPVVKDRHRLLHLPPFLDPSPYRTARVARGDHRARLAERFGLDPEAPWLLAVAMMRKEDKLASYRQLGQALAGLSDLNWRLIVVGDGPARPEVESALAPLGPDRVAYAGLEPTSALPAYYAAADVYVWPAVNEAYGLALLEAQAAGLPVVAGRVRGVAQVVRDGDTGVLVPAAAVDALAAALRRLLVEPDSRARLGTAATAHVEARHGLANGGAALAKALEIAGAGP
ncbi:MAG: glycosyltransferase family 4 protein [Alphaproteobacteria bacterium]